MANKSKPLGDLTFGKRDPLLKEIYNDKKENKKEKRSKFSKIRNIIKNQKKKK